MTTPRNGENRIISAAHGVAFQIALAALALAGVSATAHAAVLSRSTVLDPRLSVVHAGGQYPDRHVQGDFLVTGAQKAYQLGFQNLEIFLDPRVCNTRPTEPQGLYQSLKYCATDERGRERVKYHSLSALAQDADFKTVLSMPFRSFILTTDSVDPAAATVLDIGGLGRPAVPIARDRLDATYRDYKDFTSYLLKTYAGSGKNFVVESGSELDWFLVAYSGCKLRGGATCSSVPASPVAIQNAITYLNTIGRAMDDARRSNPAKGVHVYQACEVNFIVRRPKGMASATTNVLPHTHCDLIAYSAGEAWRAIASGDSGALREGLTTLAKYAPRSANFPGKNIFVSQIGYREEIDSRAGVPTFMRAMADALDWGVPYFQIWELYDNTCRHFAPKATSADCRGFWLMRPEGTPAPLYQEIVRRYGH